MNKQEYELPKKDAVYGKDLTYIVSTPVSVPMRISKTVIKGLLLSAGAFLIAAAYLTSLGFFIVGITSIIIGIMNYTAGAGAAFMFAFGGGLLALSFTAPLFYSATYALRAYGKFTANYVTEFKNIISAGVN